MMHTLIPVRPGPRLAVIGLVLLAAAAIGTRAGDAQSVHPPSHHPPPAAAGGVPLYDNLGDHSWKVTATPDAQRYFDQGLRLMWAFNHAEAIRSFNEAERLDRSCAMCAWGAAYAAGPNINAPMDSAANTPVAAALRRARENAGGATAKERALIDALSARFASTRAEDRARLDSAYATTMGRIAREYGSDPEVGTLYADALMNLSPWDYWNADGTPRPATPIILGQLEAAIAANPAHPGACHLFVHAVEATQPARAVACAERLATLMPGAGHLVHMPAHIFVRVGRYADALEANKHAVHADQAFLEGPHVQKGGIYASGYYPHNHHFLTFVAILMGNSRLALEHAVAAAAAVDPVVASEVSWIDAITAAPYVTLAVFSRWDALLDAPLPARDRRFATGIAHYARGLAFANKRRWAEARALLDSVSRIADAHAENENGVALQIAAHLLRSELAFQRGNFREALRSAEAARALEDALPYLEPPAWFFPVRHALGRIHLKAGWLHEAERVYREDLERFPENGWSLHGLAEALRRQGRHEESRQVQRRFEQAWISADVRLTK